MKVTIGPKGHRTMIRVMSGYRGSGKRWGYSHFANGRALRLGSHHLMIWWPRGNALGSDYCTSAEEDEG